MAGFQTVVNTYPEAGVPGQEVTATNAVYSPYNYISDGTAEAGAFAYKGSVTDAATAQEYAVATKTGTGTTDLIGFVGRDVIASLNDPLNEGTNIYPVGVGLNIAERGAFYAEAAADIESEGVYVLVNDGTVTYGSSGDTGDTGWIVRFVQGKTSASSGDIVIYEKA